LKDAAVKAVNDFEHPLKLDLRKAIEKETEALS
jgi:hypothetical protein